MAEVVLTTGSGYPFRLTVKHLDGSPRNLSTATAVNVYLRRVPTPADPVGALIGPLTATVVDSEAGLIEVNITPLQLDRGGVWTVTTEVTVDGIPQKNVPEQFLVRAAP